MAGRGARIVDGAQFRRLLRARDRIEDAYAEPLALADLARTAGLSPFHFLRLFQRVFGATPHAYLARVRIERAQKLLARSASVTEACLSVGYFSLGSFSARSSRDVGCSPAEWQRRVRRLVGVPARLFELSIPCCYLHYWMPRRTPRKNGEIAAAPAW